MRRLVKAVLAGVVVVAILSFFFLAPVDGFNAPTCVDGIPAGSPSYGSLSFHFFDVGEVYAFGQFSWMTTGFTVPSCF
jgi:hypothetical protein